MTETTNQRLKIVISHLGDVPTCPYHKKGFAPSGSGLCAQGGCNDEVLVAVNLSRLNSQDAYFVAGVLGVAEHEHAAILRAPRIASEWLRDEGTYQVLNSDPTPDPVQIIERDVDQACLETAVVLWDPMDLGSVYSSFEEAVDAALKVLKDGTSEQANPD